jgi:DUF4097 and DUF4098 domain-containing protein YvlB
MLSACLTLNGNLTSTCLSYNNRSVSCQLAKRKNKQVACSTLNGNLNKQVACSTLNGNLNKQVACSTIAL